MLFNFFFQSCCGGAFLHQVSNLIENMATATAVNGTHSEVGCEQAAVEQVAQSVTQGQGRDEAAVRDGAIQVARRRKWTVLDENVSM